MHNLYFLHYNLESNLTGTLGCCKETWLPPRVTQQELWSAASNHVSDFSLQCLVETQWKNLLGKVLCFGLNSASSIKFLAFVRNKDGSKRDFQQIVLERHHQCAFPLPSASGVIQSSWNDVFVHSAQFFVDCLCSCLCLVCGQCQPIGHRLVLLFCGSRTLQQMWPEILHAKETHCPTDTW